jgi:hypothetical protein
MWIIESGELEAELFSVTINSLPSTISVASSRITSTVSPCEWWYPSTLLDVSFLDIIDIIQAREQVGGDLKYHRSFAGISISFLVTRVSFSA